MADYDDDGDLDIYLCNFTGDNNVLYRNDTNNSNHWLHVSLVGTASNSSGIGARVRVVTTGLDMIREVSGGSGLYTQNSLAVEFGLAGNTTVNTLEVRWPTGVVETATNLSVDQKLIIVEGTPATPQGFTVTGNAGDNPTMYWSANTEIDLASYQLYKDEGQGWFLMTTVDKYTTSYTDYSVIIGQGGKFTPSVCYRITSLDITNQESAQSFPPRCKPLGGVSKALVDMESESIPAKFALLPAYPNPFNPVTVIKYQIPAYSKVEISVFNVQGHKLRTLVNEPQVSSYYYVTWDGKDDRGDIVSSGVYIYRIEAVSLEDEQIFSMTKKMILLR